jgi:cell wall-associated NlpC family hydrolase/outer membrane murein-binding lipoprotein Lpp
VHTPPDDRQPRAPLPLLGSAPRGKAPGSRRLRHRAASITAGLAVIGVLAATGGVAVAAPQPTISQVQKQLSQLNAKSDQLDQQYDQVQQELQSANQRLRLVNSEAGRDARQFSSMRAQIAQIAAQAYEQGSLNSSMALLTSGNPQQILNQSSILLELSSANTAAMTQFLAATKQLTSTQQAAKHTQAGIAQLKSELSARRKTLAKKESQEKALIAQLTPVQQAAAAPGGASGGAPVTAPVKYTGPTSTQAGQAVAFVFAQLGCPYVFGGTGPCGSGFDCSGLMMQAWAHAGVSIPRTSEEQWGLPHVSVSDVQPGDILEFAGESHVGMYVGNGMLIDAPHTGLNVEEVSFSGWYRSELDGVVRP